MQNPLTDPDYQKHLESEEAYAIYDAERTADYWALYGDDDEQCRFAATHAEIIRALNGPLFAASELGETHTAEEFEHYWRKAYDEAMDLPESKHRTAAELEADFNALPEWPYPKNGAVLARHLTRCGLIPSIEERDGKQLKVWTYPKPD